MKRKQRFYQGCMSLGLHPSRRWMVQRMPWPGLALLCCCESLSPFLFLDTRRFARSVPRIVNVLCSQHLAFVQDFRSPIGRPSWTDFPGLAMFSTGTLRTESEPDTSGPAYVTRCVFERNSANDGGGIYSAAGYDVVQDSRFEDNFAGGGI